jgi:hypothetical protein
VNALLKYMQEELDGLATNYPDRFKIYYVLNQVCFLIMQLVPKLLFLLVVIIVAHGFERA